MRLDLFVKLKYESSRGRPNFVFFLFFWRQKTHFLFFGVLFFGRKRHPHFRFFSFFGTKMAVKNKKESHYFGWGNARRAELWVTCSRIQPLSTSLPSVHEYCEAVRGDWKCETWKFGTKM